MATMTGTAGGRELTWTDGAWSGDEQAAAMATTEAESGDDMEIVPFGTFPLNDDSTEVVGWIIRWVLGGLTGNVVEIVNSEGMKTRTAMLDEYDGSERVY